MALAVALDLKTRAATLSVAHGTHATSGIIQPGYFAAIATALPTRLRAKQRSAATVSHRKRTRRNSTAASLAG